MLTTCTDLVHVILRNNCGLNLVLLLAEFCAYKTMLINVSSITALRKTWQTSKQKHFINLCTKQLKKKKNKPQPMNEIYAYDFPTATHHTLWS